jgi:uncharacterized protein YoxC
MQLMPLLAVFVCTMGALVVLLVAFARLGQEQAKQAATARATKSDDEAELEGLAWRVSQLQQSRDKTQQQLDEKSQELSHVEDHLRRLREQAQRLEAAAAELARQGQSRSQRNQDAEAELARLRVAIAQAERDVRNKKPAGGDQPVTYSVVPYEGPNQTRRRPIYIECRKDSVIVQPEGVVLKDTDFAPPLGPGNPLAATIRAYSEHLVATGQIEAGARPYPMLLVRPDGIEAYYAARGALTSWGNEFGYELIGSDWTLDFPNVDSQLTTKLEQAIAEARRRQVALIAAAPRQFKRSTRSGGGGGGGGLRASSRGGFIAESDARGDASGTGGGGRYTRGVAYGSGGRGGSAVGDRYSGEGGRDSQRSVESIYGDALAGGNGTGGAQGTGGGDSFPSRESPSAGAGSYGDSLSTGGERGQSGGVPTSTGPNAGGFSEAQQGEKSGGREGGNSDTKTADSSGGGAAGGRYSNDGGGPQLGNPNATAGSGGSAASGQANQQGAAGKNKLGPFGSPGQKFSADQANSVGNQSGSSADAASAGGGAAGAASSQFGAAGGGDTPPPTDPDNSQNTSATIQKRREPKSLAKTRGRDWGLPDAANNMIPVTRPVMIRCEPNRLVIMPDDKRTSPKEIALGPRTEDSIDELVSGVWDHMKGWGLAGRGLYWRPTLSLDIAKGADTRFVEIQKLLEDSGLEVYQRGTR